jgi:two-component system, OmpR family, sensor histidine kinase AdeS
MKRFSPIISIRQWRRKRRRWPLTRQIAIIFAGIMVVNGLLISTALDYWGEYAIARELKSLSPDAQRIYRDLENGIVPTAENLRTFNEEIKPLSSRLESEVNNALLIMIAVAGLITLLAGYLLIGRVGKGLGSVALAARQITEGDLTARANHVGFASREEAQLIGDFNLMSSALQRAERELAEGTAAVAHELRTPLTILRGRLHGINDGVFALEPSEVEGLLYQVEGLGRLVHDLQTLSLANSHRLVLSPEQTDLADEVRRVLATLGPDIKGAGLEPVTALTRTPLLADGARLRQVIMAVLANACRYAAGSGILRISTTFEGDDIRLEIVDHGPGLPKGGEELAFDRFWRGEASRSRNSGGSGLGLSVVRAIVEAHGGRAQLRNHAGGGAIFEMWLKRDPRLHIISTTS